MKSERSGVRVRYAYEAMRNTVDRSLRVCLLTHLSGHGY